MIEILPGSVERIRWHNTDKVLSTEIAHSKLLVLQGFTHGQVGEHSRTQTDCATSSCGKCLVSGDHRGFGSIVAEHRKPTFFSCFHILSLFSLCYFAIFLPFQVLFKDPLITCRWLSRTLLAFALSLLQTKRPWFHPSISLYISLYIGTSVVAQTVKNPPAMWETWVWSLGGEDPLEEEMATPLQYSCLENPQGQRSLVGYSPWGHRVRHDWATKHTQSAWYTVQWKCIHTHIYIQMIYWYSNDAEWSNDIQWSNDHWISFEISNDTEYSFLSFTVGPCLF